MNDQKFERLISRLEQSAADNPNRYVASVLSVALLGFGVLALALLLALLPVLALAALAFAVVATGGKALILLLKFGKLLVLLLIPAWVMVKSSVHMLLSRLPKPSGRELTAREAPALFAALRDLRRRTGGPRIHHVLLTEQLNAAIVQHPRFGLFGWEQNYLILGLPLLQAMTEHEALAVVAHEFGHLSGNHGRLGGFIYRLRAAWGRMQHLSANWQDFGSRLIARLFQWYAPYFNAYTFVLARQQEYAADRAAVAAAGQQNAANALMRVNVAARFEQEIFWPAVDRLAGQSPEPLQTRYGYWEQTLDERLDEASRLRYLEQAGQVRTDHFDTHPCLSDRLRAIGASADAESARRLAPPHPSAANIWLGDALPALRAEFDRAWHDATAEQWRERHAYLQGQARRLAELRAQSKLNTDEHWEQIRLIGELEPDTPQRSLIDALLERAPDHAPALYRRGLLRLDAGDAGGIADLERVMELDAGATLPACEAAWRYYRDREPNLADSYRTRWQERSDYENRVRAELQTLSPDATLDAHGLDAETEDKFRTIVAADSKHIRRIYLLRRVLKSDSTLYDYVLAFETTRLSLGNPAPAIIKRLAQKEFPVQVFIVHLGSSAYKGFRKRIKRLGVAPLYGK
ncbi:MAG: M48 family metallopeptidase [Rhodocyclaceae bacterium]|nr:M48 family metallopeptidase [Rhodocyclaceae bacterium]MBX3669446.1 M48 family metallopeptidase [Rhodocyclaceae bacterium]